MTELSLEQARALLEQLPQANATRQARRSAPHAESNLAPYVSKAEHVAALSGRLEPQALLSSVGLGGDELIGRGVLNALAPLFHVDIDDGKAYWSLLPAHRSEVLSELLKPGSEPPELTTLPETDRFGQMLRRVIDPNDHLDDAAVKDLSSDDLVALVAATETLSACEVEKPNLDKLYESISRRRLASQNEALLKNFTGRDQELGRLRQFLTRPSAGAWSGLIVTGFGGAGKSTLLAKFVREVWEQRLATVVLLDFDRPGIDPRDTAWLETELARQVGAQHPEAESSLRAVRKEAWQQRLSTKLEPNYSSEAKEMDRGRKMMDEVRESLSHLSPALPVLLLLDTFEEVVQVHHENHLLDWVRDLAERLHPLPLKVLFSGRLFDYENTLGADAIEAKPLELDGFDAQTAATLLEREGMPAAGAQQLVSAGIFPTRPLELKLLARLYKESPSSIDELEHELRTGGARLKGLFAGLVYRRILLRMGTASELVKQLAFPGLVLRYVTPELIRHVLVPALGLKEIDDAAAANAFYSLSAYGWFAQLETNGELRYRRDLRRATLKVAQAQEAEKTARIHQVAIQHFAGSDGKTAEALYHQLMLAETGLVNSLTLEELRLYAPSIRTDIEDLPPTGEALLLYAVGEILRPEQIALLPSPHREQAYRKVGEDCANSGEFGLALRMYRAMTSRQASDPEVRLQRWELETLFATACWGELSGRPLDNPKGSVPIEAFVKAVVLPDSPPSLLKGVETVSRQFADSSKWSTTDIARMAVALVLGRERSFISDLGVAKFEINGRMEKDRSLLYGPLGGRIALGKMLLDGDDAWIDVLLGAPVPLDPRSFADAKEFVASVATEEEQARFAAALTRQSEIVYGGVRGRRTARGMLSAVNSISSQVPTFRSSIGRTERPADAPFTRMKPWVAFGLVGAVDPELRDPVRFALLDAFQSDFQDLRRILSEVFPFELDDLKPAFFQGDFASDPEHALAPLVELVDRCGALGELLAKAQLARPDVEKLGLVAKAHQRWRDAFEQLFKDASLSTPLEENT